MRWSNLFKVSLDAVRANKTRSLLTSLGIIIGVASVILLVSIGSGIKEYVNRQFQDLGSDLLMVMPGKVNFRNHGGPPGSVTNKLTVKVAEDLARQVNGIQGAVPLIANASTVKFQGNTLDTQLLGSSESLPDALNLPATSGRFFLDSEVRRNAKVAVIGTTVVKNLFGTDDPLGQEITVIDKRYTVIGVLKSKGSGFGNDEDNRVIVPVTSLQQQMGSDKVSFIYVKAQNINNVDYLKTQINNFLMDREKFKTDEFSIVSSDELLGTINSILSVLTLALSGIAAISLVVGGIGIMNIMLVSVTERTKEIGLRKAVGASPVDILIQFLIEAVFLSLLGGITGIILGAIGSWILGRVIQTSVTWWSILMAFGFSSIVGIVFGVWPAWKASKLSPIEALRYE